jgi:hypothetical protein
MACSPSLQRRALLPSSHIELRSATDIGREPTDLALYLQHASLVCFEISALRRERRMKPPIKHLKSNGRATSLTLLLFSESRFYHLKNC